MKPPAHHPIWRVRTYPVCGVTGASTYYTSSLSNYEDVKQQLACGLYRITGGLSRLSPNTSYMVVAGEYMYRALRPLSEILRFVC